MKTPNLWQQVLLDLSTHLPAETLNLLRGLSFEQNNGHWVLWAPNRYARDSIEKMALPSIKEALGRYETIKKIELRIEQPTLFPKESSPSVPIEEAPLESHLNPDYLFENFVPGPSNDKAFAAAKSFGEGESLLYNPLLIYGGTGLGKSHLMHAAGNALVARGKKRVLYLTAESFVNHFVRVANNSGEEERRAFAERYRNLDALLIDDVQFFGGKERSQLQFFHVFNHLIDSKHRIILTCDRFPKELENIGPRLTSRFSSGLTVAVTPPELETRIAILKAKAQQVAFALPEEVAFFIASRVASNVRELEGALRRVYAECTFNDRLVTTKIAARALHDLINAQNRQATIADIQRVVVQYYHVSLDELLAKNRQSKVALPRQIAMALAKDLTRNSLPEIGQAFGGRDHTTVLHACRKIEKLCEENNDFNEEYQGLRMTLTG